MNCMQFVGIACVNVYVATNASVYLTYEVQSSAALRLRGP